MAIDARHSAVLSPWFRYTRRRNWKPARSLLLVLLGLAACEGPTEENSFTGNPAVWPQASRLGDSVGWLLSGELLFGFQAAPTPFFTWSRDNVKIGLVDEQDHEVILVPRVVFEVQSAMGAQIRGGSHEASIGAVVAMFDLPDPWPNASNPAPSELHLVLYVDDQVIPGWTNSVEILGTGGTPTAFGIASDVSPLEPGPMLRLRPRWDSGTSKGIDPDWLIAGIEFTLLYADLANGGSIANPRAIPAGDAATALSLTGPVSVEVGFNRLQVNVLLPQGFQLLDGGCDAAGCYAGHASLIDVVFDKDSGSLPLGDAVFESTDFTVADVKIVGPTGVQLNPTTYGPTYFDRFVVNNLSEGP
jgi:hypothetical protein